MLATAYQSVLVYFTTGTGNTFRAACWFVEAAKAAGADARSVNMQDASREPAAPRGPHTLVGLMSPTHGFTAPWSVIEFALKLPRGRGAHAFTTMTRAGTKFGPVFLPGFDGTANYLLALVLALKGYRVRGALALDMPSNWMSLHPGFKKPSALAMIARQKKRSDRFAERVLGGGRSFGHFVSLFFGLVVLPVSIGYLLVGRYFLAKLFFSTSRCSGCALCARACPRQAIRMLGKVPRPYWTLDCESCMRCLAFCPTKSIEAGHSIAALIVLVAVFLPADELLLRWIGDAWPALRVVTASTWLSQALGAAWLVAASVLVYAVVARLVRLRSFNALFTYTTFTHWYHRYREPGTRLKAIVGKDVKLSSKEAGGDNR